PTTLSERTLEQLYDFFNAKKYQKKKLLPFISMMQKRKNLHKETRLRLQKKYKNFLDNSIPFSTDIEKMGVNRAPVLVYAGSSPAAKAYEKLWNAIQDKVKI
ncbi:MAG: ParA family protein, partial [Deltaproteobacteria bacterium]|nr:ParA family protein [Deltaproteobacteria bacterium]